MPEKYPRTRKSLLALYGIGQRKLEKYADTFLDYRGALPDPPAPGAVKTGDQSAIESRLIPMPDWLTVLTEDRTTKLT